MQKNLASALKSKVTDFLKESAPRAFGVPDGNYICDFAGLEIDTEDSSQLVDGEPAIVVSIMFVSRKPIAGKQIKLRYNLSMVDKNGEHWMLSNLWDDLHMLGAYDPRLSFDRLQVTVELLEKQLKLLEAAQPKSVVLVSTTSVNAKTKKSFNKVSIGMPGSVASTAPGEVQTDLPFAEDPVKEGQKAKYKGREVVIVSFDDVTEEVTIKAPGSNKTHVVKLSDLEL